VASFLTPLIHTLDPRFTLHDVDAETVLATRIERAFNSETRRRGLLGRADFAEGSALVIAPCAAIHTFFMKMAIDVVFVSRTGVIVKTYSSLPAWRLAFAFGAYAAIELPAGTLTRSRTKREHRLHLVSI
jgi:uncharacterized membrane protein (UPF0127 family)